MRAARLMQARAPRKASCATPGRARSAWTKSTPSGTRLDGLLILSTTRTASPRASRRRTISLPMKPQPPVTTIMMGNDKPLRDREPLAERTRRAHFSQAWLSANLWFAGWQVAVLALHAHGTALTDALLP